MIILKHETEETKKKNFGRSCTLRPQELFSFVSKFVWYGPAWYLIWSTISARISWATHDQFPWRDFLLFTVIIGNLQRKRQQSKSSRSILILNHFLINDLRYSSYIYKTTSKSTLVVWEEQASIVLPSELKLLSVLAILQLHKGAVHERCRPNVSS